MPPNIDPREDYVFKRLFGSEEHTGVLASLLNAVLQFPAGRVVRGLELLNPFTLKAYAEDKLSVFDIKARDDPGRLFLVEMQRDSPVGTDKRLLYYWACGHSGQMKQGQPYEHLQPTYVVCFLNESLFADDVCHHIFRPSDEHGVLLCRDLEIHTVELSKFDVAVEQVKTPLEQWCYFLTHGASLDPATLPETLDVPVIRKAVEVLMRVTQDEIERQYAKDREQAQRDALSRAASARLAEERARAAEEAQQAAEEKARRAEEKAQLAEKNAQLAEKGLEEGVLKGELIGRIRLLQEMHGQQPTPREDLLRLSIDALQQQVEALRTQRLRETDGNGKPATDPA
jgi:predicted transposase/invertase (TIGR01784 family)